MLLAPEWDDRLLRGFRFACRPGCGLCCYTQPRLDREELARLRADREVPLRRDGGLVLHVESFPDGGSCRLLSENRCSVHSLRPLVCSSFPVEMYAGLNGWQPSLVLSCPGLSLEPLDDWARGVVPTSSPSGLDPELRSARRRTARTSAAAVPAAVARARRRWEARLRRRGLWTDRASLRTAMAPRLHRFDAENLPGEEPPDPGEGRELLPIFFDGRPGPVAIGAHPLGWSLDELAPRGGVAQALGIFSVPAEIPTIDDAAARRLAGYLVYWLHRDQLIDGILSVASEDDEPTPLAERLDSELGFIRSTVLSRALVRAHLGGEYGRILGRSAIDRGIAASDADLLDRDSPGSIP